MREKQVILIPKESKYNGRNMVWSDALKFFGIDDFKLKRLIESGDEINGYYVDEALIYDNTI